MEHVQYPIAIKIHPLLKFTQSSLTTAYRLRVRVKGNSDIKK